MNELDIFSDALALENPDERARYLSEACGESVGLRERIEALLRNASQGSRFLESPAPGLGPPITEQPGDTIGPYKLLEQIGEGGMGVVYMAEQTEPVARRVALKIIKPGMDSRQVIARFEAERQALAMMDHPNVSKVIDAGTTEAGRPYFVMELVKGVPITQYCDEHKLSVRERLELFVPVCQAIQHAHQKGIIHRDIKPSNVLVARYDDRPVPKIIDFGVAKATQQKLTEQTVFTKFGQIVGTFEYMSPEQAQLNQLDIDTRSDVYSLGVLLYELLTGETPFDGERLRSAAFDELLRIIREEDPPRPSLRLSTSGTLPETAANRHVEPKRLSSLVRGELDWIVMNALEKDRTRRYETATALAADIEHYLNDEAVVACPPSTAYRLRKFARRNKSVIAMMTTIAVAMVIGTGVATWQAVRARSAERLAQQRLEEEKQTRLEANNAKEQEQRQRKLAEQRLVQSEQAKALAEKEALRANTVVGIVSDLFASSNPQEQIGKPANYTVRRFLIETGNSVPGELKDQPAVEAELRSIIGRALSAFDLQYDANTQLKESLRLYSELYGEEHPKYLECLLDCYDLHFAAISKSTKARLARRASGISQLLPEHVDLRLRSFAALMKTEPFNRRLAVASEAIDFAEANNALVNRYTADIFDLAAGTRLATAKVRFQDKNSDEFVNEVNAAEQMANRAFDIRRQLFSDKHPITTQSIRQLGSVKLLLGDKKSAKQLFRKAFSNVAEFDLYYLPTYLLIDLEPLTTEEEFSGLLKINETLSDGPYFQSIRAIDQLKNNEYEEYRQSCQWMVDHWQNSQASLNVVFACMLNSNAVDDWVPVVDLAQVNHDLNESFSLLGPALYRANRIPESIDELKKMEQYYAVHDREFDDKLLNAYRCNTRLFLAMAHFKSGNTAEALQWYQKASRELPLILDQNESRWINWVRTGLQLVMDETTTLIEKNALLQD